MKPIAECGPIGESNSSKPLRHESNAVKEQHSSGFGSVAPKAPTIPTCKKEAAILLLFSVVKILTISM